MAIQFKNASGAYLLRGLFYETTMADKSSVVYTLKDEDHEGYPSLKRLYMETDDPTEYFFATNHLGGVDHWDKLCECSWFKPYVSQWRREMELKHKALALLEIRAAAKNDTHRDKFSANKYLLEKGWEKDNSSRRKGAGRPSKQEIQEAANDIAQQSSQIMEDYERLGIKMN